MAITSTGAPAPVTNATRPVLSNFDNWVISGHYEKMPSEMMHSAAYDHNSKTLKIKYTESDGEGYEPIGVEKAQQFYMAGSKGTWIWDNLLIRGKGNKGKCQVNKVSL